jgi:hypothetical protein
MLTTQSRDAHFKLSIQATLKMAKNTLNSYYNKMDYSEVHRIAMGEYHLM